MYINGSIKSLHKLITKPLHKKFSNIIVFDTFTQTDTYVAVACQVKHNMTMLTLFFCFVN